MLGNLQAAGAIVAVAVSSILAVAAIALSIIMSIRVYKKYIAQRSASEYLRDCKSDSFLGPFFSFEKYMTPGLLQYLYGLVAIADFLFSIVLLVAGILFCLMAGEILGIFAVAILVVIYIPLSQLMIRLIFERDMVLFNMNSNIQKIANGQLAAGSAQATAGKGVCPNCGHQNAETSTFCRQCGTKLSD